MLRDAAIFYGMDKEFVNKKLWFLATICNNLEGLYKDVRIEDCRLINDLRLEIKGILMEGNYEKTILYDIVGSSVKIYKPKWPRQTGPITQGKRY
jgi:hypothetical protein